MILAQEQAQLDTLFEDFKSFVLMSAKSKLRESTLETYVRHLKILFLNHGLPMDNLTVEDISRALKSRIRKLTPSTANSVVVVARRFAEFKGLDADSREMRKLFRFKRVIPTKRFTREDILMPEDIIRILDLMPSRHYRALFAVLWDTGARIGEICSLDYEDVTKDEHGFGAGLTIISNAYGYTYDQIPRLSASRIISRQSIFRRRRQDFALRTTGTVRKKIRR